MERDVSGIWARYMYGYLINSRTYTAASAPTVIGSVFVQRFRLFLAQCNAQQVCYKIITKSCELSYTMDTELTISVHVTIE